MKKLFLLVSLAVFVYSGKVNAQEQTPADISKKFFELYATKPMDAIDQLFADVKKNKQVNDDITAIKKNLKVTIDQDGQYYGYEPLTEKGVGNTIKLLSYIVKYDKQPVRFVFVFYKPKDAWKIYTFQFNTNLDEELNNAAGVDLLKENKQ